MAHQGFIKLDECINDYLSESEQGDHKYFKLWHLAFRALTELGLDFFHQIRSVKLPVQANKTVALPSDYLQYNKAGIFNERGEVVPLSYNNKLSHHSGTHPERLDKIAPDLSSFYDAGSPVFYNYWTGGGVTNLYGVPSGSPQVGQLKIDHQSGIILLNPDYAYDHLILEYTASPKEGGDYDLPVQFREAVIAYLRWKDIISVPAKTHVQNSNVQMRRRDFYNERRLAIARYKPLHLEEAYEWNLQNQRKAIKG